MTAETVWPDMFWKAVETVLIIYLVLNFLLILMFFRQFLFFEILGSRSQSLQLMYIHFGIRLFGIKTAILPL
jgi:hypothetical protein